MKFLIIENYDTSAGDTGNSGGCLGKIQQATTPEQAITMYRMENYAERGIKLPATNLLAVEIPEHIDQPPQILKWAMGEMD